MTALFGNCADSVMIRSKFGNGSPCASARPHECKRAANSMSFVSALCATRRACSESSTLSSNRPSQIARSDRIISVSHW
jgi:hypothetical protein